MEAVNRVSNVQGVEDWKALSGSITFEDVDDAYNFRPYDLVIEYKDKVTLVNLEDDGYTASSGGYTLSSSDPSKEGQFNSYSPNGLVYGSSSKPADYSGEYKSSKYNVRYYEIEESSYLTADVSYSVEPAFGNTPTDKKIQYLYFQETTHFNFIASLNATDSVPMPTEYSGSSSAKDRTGIFDEDNLSQISAFTITRAVSGGYDVDSDYYESKDDFKLSTNKITITSNVLGSDGNIADDWRYENLKVDEDEEDFLITLTQMEKLWVGKGNSVIETYTSNYSKNGQKLTSYIGSAMKVSYQSNPTMPDGSISETLSGEEFGNVYNLALPASGELNVEYLPDGKYEISFHYDIDFDSFDIKYLDGSSALTKENGKYYITFSSVDAETALTVSHTSTIDTWRGYVDDTNNFGKNQYGVVGGIVSVPAKSSIPNGSGSNGYRIDVIGNKLTSSTYGFGFSLQSNVDNESYDYNKMIAHNTGYYVPNYRTQE